MADPLTPLARLLDAAYDEFAKNADRPMYHQTWMQFTADYLTAHGVTLDAERATVPAPSEDAGPPLDADERDVLREFRLWLVEGGALSGLSEDAEDRLLARVIALLDGPSLAASRPAPSEDADPTPCRPVTSGTCETHNTHWPAGRVRCPAMTAADLRLTLEGEVLSVVTLYGGERIIASPAMERMTRDLANLCERREAEAIRQERARLAEAVEGLPGFTFTVTDEALVPRAAVLALLREEDTRNG